MHASKMREVEARVEVLFKGPHTERGKQAGKVLREMLRGCQLCTQVAILFNAVQDEKEELLELLALGLHEHLCGGWPELACLRWRRQSRGPRLRPAPCCLARWRWHLGQSLRRA